jgi:prepilin-type N-terminal cleavage/methylation domain-containing protein
MLIRGLQKKSKGFTLIELLVVVAIIGILAALLFPAIQGALLKAKAMKIGSNGRQIHLGIFDENLSLDQLDMPLIWPISDTTDLDPDFALACGSSTEYFKWCVTNEVIKGIDTAFFSAPGVTPESEYGEFDDKNNAWCVTLDLDDGTSAATPFLFTKNFNVGASIGVFADPTEPLLSDAGMPFNGKVGIVITKGGRVQVLDAKYLKPTTSDPDRGIKLFNPPLSALGYMTPLTANPTL